MDQRLHLSMLTDPELWSVVFQARLLVSPRISVMMEAAFNPPVANVMAFLTARMEVMKVSAQQVIVIFMCLRACMCTCDGDRRRDRTVG